MHLLADEATEPLPVSPNSNLSEETESLELEPDSDGGDPGGGRMGYVGVEMRYSRVLSAGDASFLTKGVDQGGEEQDRRERRLTPSYVQDSTTGGRESKLDCRCC